MTYQKLLPGILLSLLVGIAAIFLGELIPLLGPITIGLLAGITVGNLFKPGEDKLPGLNFVANKMLEFSVLFLALGINFNSITAIGVTTFIGLSMVVFLVLIFSIQISKKFGENQSVAQLTGFGTAICGSSAIAAVSPTISKSNEDTGISLAVVNLLGLGGMLILPWFLQFIGMNPLKSGLILGGGLHSVANVAGAGFAMGDEVGKISITIKLARVAMLSPALILYSYLIRKDNVKNWKEHFKLPWYIWSFIAITLLVSFIQVPASLVKQSEYIGKLVLAIALTAIGLKVSLKLLFKSGKKALIFGVLVFLVQLTMLIVFSLFVN